MGIELIVTLWTVYSLIEFAACIKLRGVAKLFLGAIISFKNKVINEQVANELKELVIARHTLVHKYRGITDIFIREQIQKILDVWPKFKQQIKIYLTKIPNNYK